MRREKLIRARVKKGLSQQVAAGLIGVSRNTWSLWERGKEDPYPQNVGELCTFFGVKDPAELDLQLSQAPYQAGDNLMTNAPSLPLIQQNKGLPPFSRAGTQNMLEAARASHQVFGTPLLEISLTHANDEALGIWVAGSAALLGPLLDDRWLPDTILEVLRIILPVVKAMPMITRRSFLHTGTAAIIGSLPLTGKKFITQEEQIQISNAFHGSLAAGWKLFTLAKTSQALAVSQAQLLLLQQVHPALPIHERSMLYSSIYNFMGVTLCQQEYYHEALHAHTSAYLAALGIGNALGVTYSLLGQGNCQYVLGQYTLAIETLKQALRTFDVLDDQQSLHTKAHLLGIWADSAMMTGDYETAQQKLDAVATLLDHVGPNEEFDRSSWYQLSGKYAGLTGSYALAAHWCEQALQELPEEWTIRRGLALMPLLSANAFMRDRDASLMALEKAKQIISVLHAPTMNHPLRQALQGLLTAFPHETEVHIRVSELVQHLC